VSDHPFYTAHGPVSAPGRFGPQVEAVPGSLPSMRTAARGLVFHYRADGDFAANGIAADRITEIDTRYAEDMLGRILQLSDEPLPRPRPASPRQGRVRHVLPPRVVHRSRDRRDLGRRAAALADGRRGTSRRSRRV
jgi:hypothetical protein